MRPGVSGREPCADGVDGLALFRRQFCERLVEEGQLHVAVAHVAEFLDQLAHACAGAHRPGGTITAEHALQDFEMPRRDPHLVRGLGRT